MAYRPYPLIALVSFRWLFTLFAVLVIGCALLYGLSWPGGQRFIESSTGKDIGHLDGLYFSVVTVSSLGYGDLRPVGPGRIVASIQVLSGLMLVGLGIAKLASGRQDIIVQRLYAGRQTDRMRSVRDALDSDCAALSTALAVADYDQITAGVDRFRTHMPRLSDSDYDEFWSWASIGSIEKREFDALVSALDQAGSLMTSDRLWDALRIRELRGASVNIAHDLASTASILKQMAPDSRSGYECRVVQYTIRDAVAARGTPEEWGPDGAT